MLCPDGRKESDPGWPDSERFIGSASQQARRPTTPWTVKRATLFSL